MGKGKSKQPSVAERRGVDPYISGTWENVLLAGPMDAVTRALQSGGATVHRDVAAPALRGKLPEPGGDWLILVQLHGHPWLFAESTLSGDLDGAWAARLSKRAKTRAIHLGHEKVSSSTFVTVFDRGKEVLAYTSTAGETTTFRGTLRPRSWLRQFGNDEDKVQDAVVRELDAFMPEFRAGSDKGKIWIETGQPDVLTAANVQSAALVELSRGPTGKAAHALQTNARLMAACENLDTEAAREALAAGADLYALDEQDRTPLDHAVCRAADGGRRGKRALALLALLCEAGVELNGPRRGVPSAAEAVARRMSSVDGHLLIPVLKALHAAGADLTLSAREFKESPMTSAAAHGVLRVVKYLQQIGIDPNAPDAAGNTALQAARESKKNLTWLGEYAFREELAQIEAVIDHLSPARKKPKKPTKPPQPSRFLQEWTRQYNALLKREATHARRQRRR